MSGITIDKLRQALREKYPHVAQIDDDRIAAKAFVIAIRRRLKDFRKTARLSQADVAKRLGVDQSVVSRIESDNGPELSLEGVFRYARACGSQPALTFIPPAKEQAENNIASNIDQETFSQLIDALVYRQRQGLRHHPWSGFEEFMKIYHEVAGRAFAETTATWARLLIQSFEIYRSAFEQHRQEKKEKGSTPAGRTVRRTEKDRQRA